MIVVRRKSCVVRRCLNLVILSAENAFACESIFRVEGPPHCVAQSGAAGNSGNRAFECLSTANSLQRLQGSFDSPYDLRICEDHIPLRMTTSDWLPLRQIRILIS